MKFGNLLRTCADDAPELENLFVCYKQLKKKLKHLPVQRQGLACGDASLPSALEERSFVQALNNDVLQFNDLFIEKEEESVIKLGDLEEQANTASTSEEIAQALTHAVDLHGQLLLLVHWSILAYTGLVKILKKHHKRTGFPIRAPHLENLLSQPFCSVELLTQLVRKAEELSQQLSTQLRQYGGQPEAARSSNTPSLPVDDLILAARTSMKAIAKDGDEATEQPSSSDDVSSEHGTEQRGQNDDGAASAPPTKRRAVAFAQLQLQPHADVSAPIDSQRAPTGDVPSAPPSKRQRANGSSIPHDAAPLGHPQLPGLVAQLSTVQHNSEGIESTSGLETSTMPQAGDTPLAAQSAEMGAPISPTIDCQAVTSQSGASTAVHLPGTMLPPAYAGPRASVMRQTQAALGLWAQLHDTAATPSTVLQPFPARCSNSAAPTQSTDQSAA